MKKIISFFFISSLLIISCGKDDTPNNPVIPQGPHIASFSPIYGLIGANVSIKGQNFSDTVSGNTVKIGSTTATVTNSTRTEILFTVPEGATTGAISVTVDGRTDTAGTFEVIEKVETSITLDKTTLELFTLDTETLHPAITGDVSLFDIVWSSADESVAIVDGTGNITGVSEGSTTITAFISEEVSANCIVNVKRSIYAAGYEIVNEKEVATVWKNGVPTYLTDGEINGRATSVFVTETDVYVCGYESYDNIQLDDTKVWKNGEFLFRLPLGTNSNTNEIYVFEEDVYVTGKSDGDAMLAKNGSPVPLNDNSPGETFGLFVNSNGVYTSGNMGNAPTTWTNSEKTDLGYNQDFFSIALDIAATDTDTYAVGFDYVENLVPTITATVWKNSEEPRYLETDVSSIARSVFIDEGDLYVVGGITVANNELPVLWKNDEAALPVEGGGVSGYAGSVFVYKGDVYISGVTYGDFSEGRVWKNGTPVSTFQGMPETFFNSVFVK